jgi:cell cycle checkpoint protein
MAPPAKRRKRNIVEASEDDEEEKPPANMLTKFLFSSPNSKVPSTTSASRDPTASPSPLKAQSRPVAASQSSSAKLSLQPARNKQTKAPPRSPSTSPEKSKGRPSKKAKIDDKTKSADLLTLFSRQAQKAQSSSSGNGTKSCPIDDIVSDPISEDDEVSEQRASSSSFVGKTALKRFRDGSQSGAQSTANASQRFLKPIRPTNPAGLDDDLRPWSERFAPLNLDELAVHKKKVADVRRWLEDVLSGRIRQRLLLLKGAAGSGKTTTIRLLARELNCELLEWRNPTGALGGGHGYQSASIQFQEFMGRGGKFGQLDTDLFETDTPTPATNKLQQDSTRKIIVIEEFPNTFARSSSALGSFRGTIQQYLAANTPSLATFGRQAIKDPIIPVVMIISETLLTTTSASADSFTAHRLLGPEIIRHAGAGTIEFNAIAPSLLAKALELVVVKEARKSGRRRTPGPLVLKRLGEIGDIRNAIASLEFLCLKGDQEADWGAKVSFTKPRKGSKVGVPLTKGEHDSLELISQREASLGIFHAVGKVVYNKREESMPINDKVEQLPDHLSQHSRPKRSQVSVDTLIDETGTDTHTFISALHENYILSCESTDALDPSSTLDYVNGCMDYLSQSDLMCASSDIFFGGRGAFGNFAGRDSGSHVLRQDEMSFQVAVRGMLFSLPYPVKRQTSTVGKGGADAFKMFYPTSLKLWKPKEELEGVIDLWATKLLKGEDDLPKRDIMDGAGAFKRPSQVRSGGSWINNQTQNRLGSHAIKVESDTTTPTPLLSLGSVSRQELLLDRLPYMAHIARARKTTLGPMRIRDIEKVVAFQGIGNPSDDSSDERDDNIASGEAWATDKPSEETSPRKKSVGIRGKNDGALPQLHVHKLVLSDDDIEDD